MHVCMIKQSKLIGAALIVVGVLVLNSCDSTEKKIATSGDNEKVAGFDVASIDSTVAPCDNFFHFSAGGWIANNPIPESEPRWGRFNALRDSNNAKIKRLLNEFSGKDGLINGSDEQLIGDLYYTGMDSAKIEKDGLTYIEPVFNKIKEVSSKVEYVDLMAYFDLNAGGNPFGVYVSPDSKNSSVNVLHMGQSGIGLPDRDYYLKDDSASVAIQEQYRKHIANMLVLKGEEATKAAEMAVTIYNMERDLASHMMSRVERRSPENTYNKMTFKEMDALVPAISMKQFFDGIGIYADTLIVGQPEYLKGLNTVYDAYPLEDWKTYSTWRVLSSAASALPHAFVKENFDFYGKTLGGSKEMKPRWKRVLSSTNALSEQLGHLFIKKHFSQESKNRVEQMVEDLRSAYRERILQLDWMTDETKKKALEKLEAFTYKIGYPNKWKDYSDLAIDRASYLQNLKNVSAYKVQENYSKLGKPVDKDDWFMGAHIVNAYYNPQNNEVVFPAGILQPPFYNPDADDAINYGGIGGVIGHEFTHGFDDQGSKYGPDGNLENWWTDEDRERFDTLAQRLIEQYSSYEPIEGVFVKGDLTIGENIADLGGLTLAYHAYQKSKEGKDPVAPIDGFTDDQRVFLGWAQVWQMHATESYTRRQVMTDPHSPAEYRVVGPMVNMPEFQEAWGCDPTTNMVQADSAKIIIW